jgi:TonB family protein
MNLRLFLTVASVALLFPALPSLASALPPQDTPTQDLQKRADALLDKAHQLSDIRSPNAPSFRLKATFSFIGKDLGAIQGTYTEIWVSKSKWRRETVVKDWRRIEVGGAARFWLLDNTKDFPEQAAFIPNAIEIFRWPPVRLAFESLSGHPEMTPPAECALTKPDPRNRDTRLAFCFDTESGVLLGKIFPEVRSWNIASDSCDYRSFHKVLDHWFPHVIVCFEDRHRKLDVSVVDISSEPSPDPALFTPPPGAIELGVCQVKPQPPRPAVAPNPRWPPSSDETSQVTVSLVVDTKGKPQNVNVVNSAGAHFDEAAVSAVRSWQFWPATCSGEPMPMQINLQVHFPRYVGNGLP